MAMPLHFQVNFDPDKGVFDFAVDNDEKQERIFSCELPPDQFIALAQYFGQVGVSYIDYLKKNQ